MGFLVDNVGSRGLRSHYDELEGRVYGLCTESLGSESSCHDGIAWEEGIERALVEREERSKRKMRRRGEGEGRKARRFPPPLPSLVHHDENGLLRATRNFSFMQAVRKDGRLLLTEIRGERAEILHATREDGRLIIHLLRCPPDENEEDKPCLCHGMNGCGSHKKHTKNVDHIAQFGKIDNPRFVLTA